MKHILRYSSLALLFALLLAIPMAPQAQIAPAGQAAGIASVNYSQLLVTATAVAGAAATATLSPPAGMFTYVTAYEVSVCGDNVGDAAAATPFTFTLAGFTTKMIHKVSSTHTAGVCSRNFYNFGSFPMKSATTGSGVAQTITSSSSTDGIPSIHVWGYFDSK